VETFSAIAEACRPAADSLWVIDDALRGDVFVERFEAAGSQGVRLVPFEAWLAETALGDLVTGPGVPVWKNRIEERGLRLASPEIWRPTARAVAAVGARLAERGTTTDPFALVPLYIRRSAAEEKLDSMSAKGDVA
jgi:tRNA A37 threonylcarbamoyladenosine modification protein TsaB